MLTAHGSGHHRALTGSAVLIRVPPPPRASATAKGALRVSTHFIRDAKLRPRHRGHDKRGPVAGAPLLASTVRDRAQKSMPPPGIGGVAGLSLGISATIASVVINRPATDAAS